VLVAVHPCPLGLHSRLRLALQFIERSVLADVRNHGARTAEPGKARGFSADRTKLGLSDIGHLAIIDRKSVIGAVFINQRTSRTAGQVRLRGVRGNAMHENGAPGRRRQRSRLAELSQVLRDHPGEASLGRGVIEVMRVVSGQDLKAPVLLGGLIKINQGCDEVVVSMRKIGHVLVPLDGRTYASGLHVELAMLEAEVPTDQRLDLVEQARVVRQAAESLMLVIRAENPPRYALTIDRF